MKHILALIILWSTGLAASAQDTVTIATYLNSTGIANITLPDALNARLVAHEGGEEVDAASSATGGYRIQAYSGNNGASSKRVAEGRAAAIRERFPEQSTYVIYNAPYWRLRVGNFPTHDHASAVLADLKKAFPAFAREMRLVRDRIKK